jgi:phospholipase/carboxylesterase
MERLCTV